MVTVSRVRIAVLIIAIVATIATVALVVVGTYRPTIISNTAFTSWIIFVALTIGRDVTRTVSALAARRDFDTALQSLVDTGSMTRPNHLRKID